MREEKTIDYLIAVHFSECPLEKKNDIIGCLSDAWDGLMHLRESKINLNQFEREIKALKRQAKELQRFSSEHIYLDKLPLHYTKIYFYMSNYLFNMYQTDYKKSGEIFLGMFEMIFATGNKRKPKITKAIKDEVNSFYKIIEKLPTINEKWLKTVEANPKKSLKEVVKIFVKNNKPQ